MTESELWIFSNTHVRQGRVKTKCKCKKDKDGKKKKSKSSSNLKVRDDSVLKYSIRVKTGD